MLPAERRVRRPEDFTATVRDGRRVGGHGLILHVAATASTTPARAGFVVGRAVGSSVVRNRVRRQLRHQLRPRLEALPAGTDIVVRVSPGAASLPRRELAARFETLLSRAERSVLAR